MNLRNAEEWLLKLDYSASKESRIKRRQEDRLTQVKQLLISILPDVDDIRITSPTERHPQPRAEFRTPDGWIPLGWIGYGYQTLVAWIVDFASRMVDRYPRHKDPLKQPAVVLVDEIDLHMHPRWQRELMTYLSAAWVKLIVALGCGLLLGAVQLLPTVDALANSARRSADVAFAYTGSLHPLNLIQLVAPYTFPHRVIGENTHELGLYVGAVPLMLVAWLVARRASLGPLRPLATAAGVFAVVALLMALGRYGVLYRLQALLPIVGSFRYPCRYLVLFQLAVAVLAAIGFVVLVRDYQRSCDKPRESSASDTVPRRTVLLLWRRFEPLWIVAGVAVLVALAAMLAQSRGQLASLPAILAKIGRASCRERV